MEPLFTPGAERVWQLAAEIARDGECALVEPEHLLWALVLDESLGSEILAEHCLSKARLHELLTPPPQSVVLAPDSGAPALACGETLEAVFIEARRQATSSGRFAEVATEHLLGGLASVESTVKTLLNEHGIEAEGIARRSSGQGGIAAERLPTEIQLALAVPASENTGLYRILDAAANRAREGLRVLEDYARFSADDRHLTEILKTWRHRLADALQHLDGRALISARDTRHDVGTTVHTQREATRGSLADVVRASCKRVQEAARTLEEYGKLVSPEFASALGELRYAGYTIEKALVTTFEARDRLGDCRLYVLVTQKLCPGGAGPVIRAALAAGASVIQVREKHLSDRELVDWGRRVREWTSAAGALYIMNDRPDLAVLTDADGVHVGQDELSVHDARRIVGPDKLVGVSTHSIGQARTAVLDGADYIGVGPVFPSATKSFDAFAGLDFVRDVASEITRPAFAIGGIDAGNIHQVISAGANRVAVSGTICAAEDPAQATRDLVHRLHSL